MQVITSVFEMQSMALTLGAKGRLIGLVPTMGALHAGHLSLIEAARGKCDTVVVSVFVNPLQFGPNEDTTKYPRTPEADLALCEKAGADVVFMPSLDEIYPKGYSSYVTEEFISKPLCGVSRPNHFRGVLTMVAKLLNIVQPDTAFFGQKDAQQAAVVKKMVNDLHFCVDVVVCPTVRESDGLACGVKNPLLENFQREDATFIHQALVQAKEMVDAGTRSVDRIVAEATHLLGSRRRIRVIYIAVVDRCTMETSREVLPGKNMMVIAAWIDEHRLIDNILL
ncbi:MAG TPA: pantoate--beta-alanine ligase [Opitutaceae bacterium]|nr:pantoate--beta-alanine ligase [Opitutaceae bacterium]